MDVCAICVKGQSRDEGAGSPSSRRRKVAIQKAHGRHPEGAWSPSRRRMVAIQKAPGHLLEEGARSSAEALTMRLHCEFTSSLRPRSKIVEQLHRE
uniref:Uncharacterized protein n=1 Tax=Plectus sambesii TaxID=2011161 RepID=A0A914X7I2_9BILA